MMMLKSGVKKATSPSPSPDVGSRENRERRKGRKVGSRTRNRPPRRRFRRCTYANFEYPSQRSYVQLCDSLSRVSPDPLLLETLPFGVVFVDLDNYTIGAAQALAGLLKSDDGRQLISSVYFNFKVASKRDCYYTNMHPKRGPLSRRERREFERYEEKFRIALQGLASCLSHYDCAVERIEINGITMVESFCKILATGVRKAPKLKSVEMINCKCGDTSASILCSAFSDCQFLSELSLKNCCLSDASTKAICHLLRAHGARRYSMRWSSSLREDTEKYPVSLRGIVTLDLSENRLGDGFARGLSDLLQRDEWVRAVNLLGNAVTARGVEDVLSCLERSNSCITVVDLRENSVGTEAALLDLDGVLAERNAAEGSLLWGVRSEQDNVDGDNVIEVVSRAIVKWSSGHQLLADTAEVVSAIATASSFFSAADVLGTRSKKQWSPYKPHMDASPQLSMIPDSHPLTAGEAQLVNMPKTPSASEINEEEAALVVNEIREAIRDAIKSTVSPAQRARVAELLEETLPGNFGIV